MKTLPARTMLPRAPTSGARAFGARPRGKVLPEVGLRGTGIHAMSRSECVDHVMDELDLGRGGWALVATIDHLLRTRRNPEYRAMVEEADLRVPDGKLLSWACRLQRTPLPDRVRGQDLALSLCTAAAQRGKTVFLLGGRPGTVQAAAEVLRKHEPELAIVGTECPEPDFESDSLALAKLSRKIDAARPDIVFVGLESPVQERVVRFLRHDRPEAWWIGLGDRLYYVSGELRSCPRWIDAIGANWLHQLLQEPRRLFGPCARCVPYGAFLLLGSGLRGTLPVGKREGSYGIHMPAALVVDDDPHALDQLEILLTSRFPDLEVETRTEPDVSGRYDFYFLDNDFGGERRAAELAARVRAESPHATIFAFSGLLDVATLKRLINSGCDGVCDKAEPRSWLPILELMDGRLADMRKLHALHNSFGGVRQSAASIRELLASWNERSKRNQVDVTREKVEA